VSAFATVSLFLAPLKLSLSRARRKLNASLCLLLPQKTNDHARFHKGTAEAKMDAEVTSTLNLQP
jgi:hypothetical protein